MLAFVSWDRRSSLQRVGFDPAEITGFQFGIEDLAPGGVDALTNDHEGLLRSYEHFPGG